MSFMPPQTSRSTVNASGRVVKPGALAVTLAIALQGMGQPV